MVPVSLQLTNFLSYGIGNEPLDFTGFHVACLSGNNGHGKSALLDGLTWALWGKARHSTPHLLRLGTTNMSAEFVFDLDGERYRVTRAWTKKKKGGDTVLELNIKDEESGLYRALTGASMSETERKINAILRMDYETFITSAYLKQGEAARFSQQRPGERKDVLAEILGLSRYQEISDVARREWREGQNKVAGLEGRIDAMEGQLAQRAEAQRLFAMYDDELRVLTPQIAGLEETRDELRARRSRLEADKKRGETLLAELENLEAERKKLLNERAQWQSKQRVIDDWQAQAASLTSDYQAFRTAREDVEKWQAIDEKWRDYGEQYQQKQNRIRELESEFLTRKAGAQAELSHAENLLKQSEETLSRATEIEAGFARLQSAREREAEYSNIRASYDAATQNVAAAREELREQQRVLDGKLHGIEAQIAEYSTLSQGVEEWRAKLQKAQNEVATLEESSAQKSELDEQSSTFSARLKQLEAQVKSEERAIAENQQKLRVLAANPQAQCPLCESQLGEHGHERIQENIEDEIANAQSSIAEYTEEARLVKSKKAALDEPLAALKKRLENAPRLYQNVENARAQFERAQDASRKLEILSTQRTELQESLARGDFAPAEFAALQAAEAALQNVDYDASQHAQLQSEMRALSTHESAMNELRFARAQHEDASTRANAARATIAQIDEEISSGSAARTEKTEAARLKVQADALGYGKPERELYKNARAEAKRLEKAGENWHKLQSVLAGAGETEEGLQNVTAKLSESETRLQKLQDEQGTLRDVAAQIAAGERELNEATQKITALRERENEARTELGKNRGVLEQCEQIERERAALEDERKKAARESLVLEYTTKAFGKDGIQALIIENAIPEIQSYANEILARLTRNHMQILLESQKETATGSARETLDIKISDERGTREYSLFSGGEAFRADFALRIALSKLLARRAGTQLRTLIIDEGFGTQDPEGLQQMIECIQAISVDFEKVLVVTHLDELKSAFPTRIEVTKQPDTGSHYQILNG